MKLIDKMNSYVGTEYNKKNFHCWHLVEAILPVPKLLDVHVDTALNDVEKYKDQFEEILNPENYCIVLLGKSHIGIWYRYNVLHCDMPAVRFESERSLRLKYPLFRYYRIKDTPK